MSLTRRRWPSWEYSLEIRLRPGGWARRGDIAATATTTTLGGCVENHDPLTNTRGGADRCARPEGAAHPGLGGSERGRPERDLLIAYVVAGAAESTATRSGLCHRRRWIIDRSAIHVTTQQNVDSLSKIRNKTVDKLRRVPKEGKETAVHRSMDHLGMIVTRTTRPINEQKRRWSRWNATEKWFVMIGNFNGIENETGCTSYIVYLRMKSSRWLQMRNRSWNEVFVANGRYYNGSMPVVNARGAMLIKQDRLYVDRKASPCKRPRSNDPTKLNSKWNTVCNVNQADYPSPRRGLSRLGGIEWMAKQPIRLSGLSGQFSS